jgi:hypothetical protein
MTVYVLISGYAYESSFTVHGVFAAHDMAEAKVKELGLTNDPKRNDFYEIEAVEYYT